MILNQIRYVGCRAGIRKICTFLSLLVKVLDQGCLMLSGVAPAWSE